MHPIVFNEQEGGKKSNRRQKNFFTLSFIYIRVVLQAYTSTLIDETSSKSFFFFHRFNLFFFFRLLVLRAFYALFRPWKFARKILPVKRFDIRFDEERKIKMWNSTVRFSRKKKMHFIACRIQVHLSLERINATRPDKYYNTEIPTKNKAFTFANVIQKPLQLSGRRRRRRRLFRNQALRCNNGINFLPSAASFSAQRPSFKGFHERLLNPIIRSARVSQTHIHTHIHTLTRAQFKENIL